MKGSTGQRLPIPHKLVEAISSAALRRGLVVSDEVILLAVAQLPRDSIARRALEGAGVTESAIVKELRAGDSPPEATFGDVAFPPSWNVVDGWAQGFAAAVGENAVRPEHFLLGVIWDPNTTASHLLWRLGVPRERIVEQLSKLGVRVPRTPLPIQREAETGDRVWFGRADLPAVQSYLAAHIADGVAWGFNVENDRAWVIAESSVPLERLVSQATESAPR